MKRLTFAALLLLPTLAAAGMYRWVDAQGQVHYTQTPPPGGKADEVKPAAAPDANPGMDAIRKFNSNADKASAEAAKKQAEADSKRDDKAARCKQAQDNIKVMESRPASRVSKQNEDGTMSRMTAEEYDDNLAESRAAAKRYCK